MKVYVIKYVCRGSRFNGEFCRKVGFGTTKCKYEEAEHYKSKEKAKRIAAQIENNSWDNGKYVIEELEV